MTDKTAGCGLRTAYCQLIYGAPGAIPTRDLPLRRRTLYATELREHTREYYNVSCQLSVVNHRRLITDFLRLILNQRTHVVPFQLLSSGQKL